MGSSITKLPAAVVNQIAAGEVIERPASVVKELLENALDAGAERIDVTVEAGGRDLVRVQDDGRGIAAADLPLAIAPHATSKLRTADQLFAIQTYGFRGEALASIASVSQLRLQSRPAEALAGAQIEAAGDQLGGVQHCGCPPGTTVEVRNLFFNMPVRRRYMKSAATEIGHLTEAFTRVALAHPEIALSLRHNGRTLFELPATGQLLERLALFFGPQVAERLIWVESEHGGRRLWGYVADPSESRSNARTQYLYVNGRYVRDRSLSHALSEAYRGLLTVGRYPVAFLFWEIPPGQVDVNVHPTKIEVRLRQAHECYSQLLGTLRDRFLQTDLTARLELSAPVEPTTTGEGGGQDELRRRVQDSLQDFFRRSGGSAGSSAGASSRADPAAAGAEEGGRRDSRSSQFQLRPPPSGAGTGRLPLGTAPRGPAAASPPQPTGFAPATSQPPDQRAGTAVPPGPVTESSAAPPEPRSAPAASARLPTADSSAGADSLATQPQPSPANAMQVHDSYLVVETPDGMMVIDQHALHERILYEQLRTRLLGGQLELQRLLVPETVELTAVEAAAVAEHRELLAQLGLDVQPFGGNTVAIHTVPVMLAAASPGTMLRDLIAVLADRPRGPDRRDLLDRLLHRMACKAAIKAGQRLSPEEVRALADQRHLAQDHHHCPHGRPTALLFSKGELERQFKRT